MATKAPPKVLNVPASTVAHSTAGIGQKTGLKKTTVGKGHFSVRDSKDDSSTTRFVVRILKGTHLLASDIMTEPPTSDPICFGWVGFPEWSQVGRDGNFPDTEREWGSDILTPDGAIEDQECHGQSKDKLFRTTKVVPGTLDPKWDEKLEFDVGSLLKRDAQKRLFTSIREEMEEQDRQARLQAGLPEPEADLQNPLKNGQPTEEDFASLEVELQPEETLQRLLQLSCFIYVRDADPAYLTPEGDPVPQNISYDELGRVLLPFTKVIDKARHANGALVTNCLSYPLQKTPGMPTMPLGTELGALSLGCTLVLGNDPAGKCIKAALTPKFVEKPLDARAFCTQLKKAQKGEPLEIPPKVNLTGRRRTNSRSQSPSRARSSLDQTRPSNRLSSSNGLNATDGSRMYQRPATADSATSSLSRPHSNPRLNMRNSLDLSKVQESIQKANKVGEELMQPWKNKAAERYNNNEADNDDNIQVLSKPVSTEKLNENLEDKLDKEKNHEDSVGGSDVNESAQNHADTSIEDMLANGPNAGNQALPPGETAIVEGHVDEGEEPTPEKVAGEVVENGNENMENEIKEKSSSENDMQAAAPEEAGKESPKPSAQQEKGTEPNLTTPSKENQINDATKTSPSSASSKIPRGAGSSAVKALRPDEHGEQSILQRTLVELKELTQESLRDLSGRMSKLEKKVDEVTSPSRASISRSSLPTGMSAGPAIGDQSAPPPTAASLKRAEKKNLRVNREADFRQFKERAKENKRTRQKLDEVNGLPRGSSDGPVMEFIHGSKLQNTISAARLDSEADVRGSVDRSVPLGMPALLSGGPGMGDEGANPEDMNTLTNGAGAGANGRGAEYGRTQQPNGAAMPSMTRYHPAPGTQPATTPGLGQTSQPLRLNAAPLPIAAPVFSSPDWSRVDVWLRAGDLVSAYSEVLDRGSPDDFGRLLLEGGIHPYALSASLLNRVCDMVGLILLQGTGTYTETCLLFILAVLRDSRITESKQTHSAVLLGRTKHALTEALTLLASKANNLPSKQALLAGLLQTQLNKI